MARIAWYPIHLVIFQLGVFLSPVLCIPSLHLHEACCSVCTVHFSLFTSKSLGLSLESLFQILFAAFQILESISTHYVPFHQSENFSSNLKIYSHLCTQWLWIFHLLSHLFASITAVSRVEPYFLLSSYWSLAFSVQMWMLSM